MAPQGCPCGARRGRRKINEAEAKPPGSSVSLSSAGGCLENRRTPPRESSVDAIIRALAAKIPPQQAPRDIPPADCSFAAWPNSRQIVAALRRGSAALVLRRTKMPGEAGPHSTAREPLAG